MKIYLQDICAVAGLRTLSALLGLSFFITILEAASISAVIPTIGIILGEGLPPVAKEILHGAGVESTSSQIIIILILVSTVFLFRGVLISGTTFLQSRLIFDTQSRLSSAVLNRFISARFESITNVPSASMVRTSTTELYNVTLGILLPLASITSELALIAGSMVILFLVQPLTALILLASIVALSAPVFWLNRRRLNGLGEFRLEMESDRISLAQELVSGIREIKVYSMESEMQDSIDLTNGKYASIMTEINFLQNFPRVYFETIGVCALLIICATQIWMGRSNQDVVMFITVAAFAAFRSLPSVAKILSQLQALKFYRPSLRSYLNLLEELKPAADNGKSLTFCSNEQKIRIVVKDAGYRHGEDKSWIFRDVNFELHTGEIIGLTGPSGVGKSTLLDCLIGLREVTCGQVSILDELTDRELLCRVAYVPQSPVILDGTIKRNITLARKGAEPDSNKVRERIGCALALSGMDSVLEARGLTLGSHIVEGGRNFSGGQRQRLALTRALYRDSNILILDEASSALDAESEKKILRDIRQYARNQIVIMVTHRTELLSYCDVVITMEKGGSVNLTRKISTTANELRVHE